DMLTTLFDNIIVCYDGNAIEDSLSAAERIASFGKKSFICTLPTGEKDDPNDLYLSGELQHYLKQPIEFSPMMKIRMLFERRKSLKKY
ncbi:MAG: hypothetical protein PHX51_08615, partial [Clostridia bacterium]|nr:hypothetical protein [Clostridia bacterium]